MPYTFRVASYWPLGQGVVGYEAAKIGVNRAGCYLYYCCNGSTGNEERSLRSPVTNGADGGCCLHSLRI